MYNIYLALQLQLQFQFGLWFELFLIGKVVHIMRTIILFFHAYFIVHNLFGGKARKGETTEKVHRHLMQTKGSCRTFVLSPKKFLKDVGNDECNELRRRLVLPPYDLASSRHREGQRKGRGRGRYLHCRYSQDLRDLVEAVWGHDFNFSNDKRIF